jgi:predicted ArsR family transcriptional regulator
MSTGGRPQTVSDDDIVRYLRETDERVVSTSEAAEALDVSTRTALRRLSELADEGRIGRKDLGERSTVWWALDDAPEAPATPLRRLVGAVDAKAAAAARERSDAWRQSVDEELAPDDV